MLFLFRSLVTAVCDLFSMVTCKCQGYCSAFYLGQIIKVSDSVVDIVSTICLLSLYNLVVPLVSSFAHWHGKPADLDSVLGDGTKKREKKYFLDFLFFFFFFR